MEDPHCNDSNQDGRKRKVSSMEQERKTWNFRREKSFHNKDVGIAGWINWNHGTGRISFIIPGGLRQGAHRV